MFPGLRAIGLNWQERIKRGNPRWRRKGRGRDREGERQREEETEREREREIERGIRGARGSKNNSVQAVHPIYYKFP